MTRASLSPACVLPKYFYRSCVSALVEEPALCDAGLVLRRDIDVSRRQQEHLLRHPLDTAVKTKHQTGRKVDKSLRVRVIHLSQIHDHRGALTEVFPDGTGLVVGPRVECGDPVRLSFRHDL